MHRIALGFAVWSLLLLAIAALSALARPAAGPPMPRGSATRTAIEALVPEREVRPEAPRRAPRPGDMSGTVAPTVEPQAPVSDPVAAESSAAPESDPVGSSTNPQSSRPIPRDTVFPGLGALPAGVPAEEEGFGLHVVRADGRPAIDATVRWILQRDLDRLRAEGVDVDALHPADLLARAPHTGRTTSGGFAMLTSTAGTMVMDARLGDSYGYAVVRREDLSYLRLTISRVSNLRVRVVDAAGAPRAGVPVVLSAARCRTIWSASTDAAGHAELRFADGALHAARARFDDLQLSVDVPGGSSVVLPRAEIPDATIELVAPVGRKLLVWVRDVDARSCDRPTVVRLAPLGREGDCALGRVRTAIEGLAVFDEVPGGLELSVRAETACSPEPLATVVRTRDDAETNVVLAATARMPRVSGRLLDPRGNPWREFEVVGWRFQDGAWREQGSARTDQAGAFELDVPALHRAPAALGLVLVARNPWGRTVASPPLDLEPGASDAARDVGELRAPDWPVLIRGLVLDEGDRPIPGALVEACDAAGSPDPRTRVTCDDRGAFTLRGPAPDGDALQVRAVEPERLAAAATVALRRGEQRARIVIAVHGRLEGRVLLSGDVPDAGLIVRVEQPSGSTLALSVDGSGAFAFSNVEAGEARVSFVPQGFEEPLLVLERVVVPRGASSADPRLGHVDLSAVAAVLELEVVDERGQPILTGWVGPPSADPGRPRGRPYEMVDGVARIVVARGAPVQVFAQGYEPALIPSPAGRVRVELRPEGG